MKTVKAADILEKGMFHMVDRASTYDKPKGERSIPPTVAAYKAITGTTNIATDEQGWLFMVILKLVRSQQGDFKLDNYEDAAAYCALMGESAAEERNQVSDEILTKEEQEIRQYVNQG